MIGFYMINLEYELILLKRRKIAYGILDWRYKNKYNQVQYLKARLRALTS